MNLPTLGWRKKGKYGKELGIWNLSDQSSTVVILSKPVGFLKYISFSQRYSQGHSAKYRSGIRRGLGNDLGGSSWHGPVRLIHPLQGVQCCQWEQSELSAGVPKR